MLTVDITSWHFRIYDHWRTHIARKPPNQIDLCHYMRAIMLFTPGYYIGVGIFCVIVSLAFAVAAAFLLVTVPLWGPVWLVTHNKSWHKRGARRFADGVARNSKRLAGWLEVTGGWVIVGIAITTVVVAFTLMTLKTWWLGLAWFGGITGGILLFLAAIYGLVTFIEWYGPRLRERRRRKLAARPTEVKLVKVKKQKGTSSFRLLWAFIKAKKKRICPLIQTTPS
jgi:hypothetical protein